MNTNTGGAENGLLDRIISFSRLLQTGGIAVNSSNLIALCQGMKYIDIAKRNDFYAAARACLIMKANDLESFDFYFRHFWEKPLEPEAGDVTDEQRSGNADDAEDSRFEPAHSDLPPGQDDPLADDSAAGSYSPEEVLLKRDIGAMSEQEIAQARELVAPLIARLANHQSRRYRRDKRGYVLDFRRMLQLNALRGKDGMSLAYRRKRIRKVKLLLLCDVSGSMQTYTRFIIQFIYALYRELNDFEVAVFSTRMTPVTDLLKNRSVEESLALVADSVHDWAGGTTIGACIGEFNDKFARDMLRSRSTVLILSDGWDRGDTSLLKAEIQRLHKRSHKLIWLNPLLGNPLYKPLCQGIRTALPFVDYFLPAHSLQSLADLVRILDRIQA